MIENHGALKMVLCAPPLNLFLTGSDLCWLEFGFCEIPAELETLSQSILKTQSGHSQINGLWHIG